MLLHTALEQALTAAPMYYLVRSCWPKDCVVYIYRPLAAVLLNKQHAKTICSEEQKLIKENLLSRSIDFCEYKPTIQDLLAKDWSVIERSELLKQLEYN